jgi:hypothetical protein
MGVGKDLWTEVERLMNKHDWQGLASLYDNDAVFVDPTGRYEGRGPSWATLRDRTRRSRQHAGNIPADRGRRHGCS